VDLDLDLAALASRVHVLNIGHGSQRKHVGRDWNGCSVGEQLERIEYGSGTWLLLGTWSCGRVCLAGFNGTLAVLAPTFLVRVNAWEEERSEARCLGSGCHTRLEGRWDGRLAVTWTPTMAGPQQFFLRELLS
jgi:hypothetical protein